MKTPAGWALAGMWYDRFQGMPPRGSLLESLFMLVYLRRQETQLMATRALVQVQVLGLDSKAAQDPAIEAYQKYSDMMLPFLERAQDQDKEQEREALKNFVKKRARVDMKPFWKQQAEHAKRIATLRRFALKPTIPGAPHRRGET